MGTLAGDAVAEAKALLNRLGFTETEALVYCDLLKNPASTGYRVARSIGKAQANAYQALSGLIDKGAVEYDDSEPRTYRAVPARELLDRLQRDLERRFEAAGRSLEALEVRHSDENIYKLTHPDQVFARARSLIANARETLIFELFPLPFEELAPELGAAARRGVRTVGLVLRPEDVAGDAECIATPIGPRLLDRWPGHLAVLIADAAEMMIALFNSDDGQVEEAIWTDNAIVTAILHNAITSDILLHRSMTPDYESPNLQLLGMLPRGLRELFRMGPAAVGPGGSPQAGASSSNQGAAAPSGERSPSGTSYP